ncbi:MULTISPECIES: hypothetical protein [unclassified Thioalkalivibrio]|uniref:hypothetical protein n=1 Tax=unclassified Thioalkalivibrio TaxID=2621013 RepID=UPI000373641F|nr:MULTISPECIES: hypothetical protein [unclassified Thioalkalivibrio]
MTDNSNNDPEWDSPPSGFVGVAYRVVRRKEGKAVFSSRFSVSPKPRSSAEQAKSDCLRYFRSQEGPAADGLQFEIVHLQATDSLFNGVTYYMGSPSPNGGRMSWGRCVLDQRSPPAP